MAPSERSAHAATEMTATLRFGGTAAQLITLATAWLAGVSLRAETPVRWAVCYSDRPAAADLAGYDLVVLDAVHHPPLAPLRARGQTVLAYLSLTEMGESHAAFNGLQAAGVVLDVHPAWAGTHYLDFRRPEWSSLVLDRLVPDALAAGFTGIFLDTIDDAAFLEAKDPVAYAGMQAAAVRLVRSIRRAHPGALLMVNRGYAVMPEMADAIDVLLGESVIATFDPQTKRYARVAESDVEWQVHQLRRAKSVNPSLKLLTLDYWDPADAAGVRAIYDQQRASGFSPYVSTPLLDAIVLEPAPAESAR